MFCEKCGTLLQDGDRFCMNCGFEVKVPDNLTKNTSIVDDGILHCSNCGTEVEKNEKYCIECGTPIGHESKGVKTQVQESEFGLQRELLEMFQSNKITSFFLRYGMVFVLVYPIYSLMGRWEFLEDIYNFLTQFSILFYYVYNLGLLATYSNKQFLGLFTALSLRLLNSLVLVFQSASPWPSLFRIGVIIVSTIFVYKKLMTEAQRKSLVEYFKGPTLTCSKCGAVVKTNDSFCPKCGNRM